MCVIFVGKWLAGNPGSPIIFPLSTDETTAQGDNGVCPANRPTHPGFFESLAD